MSEELKYYDCYGNVVGEPETLNYGIRFGNNQYLG